MDSFELYDKLKRIPFLKLGNVSYLEELKNAVEQVKDRQHNQFQTSSPLTGVINFDLDVMSLYDYSADPNDAYVSTTILSKKANFNLWQPTVPSEISEEFPVFKSAVTDFLDHPARCRLSKLPIGKKVILHSHSYLHNNPSLLEIILHLAINSDKTKAIVVDNKFKKFETHFAEGEVWYLNTWLRHSFDNSDGSFDRYHIWYNAYLADGEKKELNKRLHNLFEEAVSNYEGPYANV
jgi:hypothetical protein